MILVHILGHLGADAETKTINEKQYLAFRVASTERKGEQSETTWVSVLASYQENLLPYLKKGQQVFVSGRLKASIYQSSNSFGIDLSVFSQTLQLCGGRREETQQQEQVHSAETPAPFPAAEVNPKEDDSELPF